jgi:glyoxylase-like metal-dependent hydrolase (beta-lactamase superfamily II)
VLADIMRFVPWEGFGPFESYEAEHTVRGGERLSLAGLDVEVLFTPGHSPGHVTYAIAPCTPTGEAGPAGAERAEQALLSGDVLFQGSVGRTDLPGADWDTLERSLGELLGAFPPQTVVHPGHMGATTLGRERDTNPFLAELRVPAAVEAAAQAPSGAVGETAQSPAGAAGQAAHSPART